MREQKGLRCEQKRFRAYVLSDLAEFVPRAIAGFSAGRSARASEQDTF